MFLYSIEKPWCYQRLTNYMSHYITFDVIFTWRKQNGTVFKEILYPYEMNIFIDMRTV